LADAARWSTRCAPGRRHAQAGRAEPLLLATKMLALAQRTNRAPTAMWGELWRIDALIESGQLAVAAECSPRCGSPASSSTPQPHQTDRSRIRLSARGLAERRYQLPKFDGRLHRDPHDGCGLPAPELDRLLLEILPADERSAGDGERERHSMAASELPVFCEHLDSPGMGAAVAESVDAAETVIVNRPTRWVSWTSMTANSTASPEQVNVPLIVADPA
jgi:hypothetical protein